MQARVARFSLSHAGQSSEKILQPFGPLQAWPTSSSASQGPRPQLKNALSSSVNPCWTAFNSAPPCSLTSLQKKHWSKHYTDYIAGEFSSVTRINELNRECLNNLFTLSLVNIYRIPVNSIHRQLLELNLSSYPGRKGWRKRFWAS